jgi:Glycosyl hydrolases family 32 N-terminal domain
MILGARKDEDVIGVSGRTVWYTSTELEHWTFEGDFWAPDLYTMHEMPDLFRMGDRWYLLTTEYSDRSKTVYRSSESLAGPWTSPVDDAFDGRAYYAARSAADHNHRYLFGWVPTKQGDTDLGAWQWGGTLVVHEVYQRLDRSLGVRIPRHRARSVTHRRAHDDRAPVAICGGRPGQHRRGRSAGRPAVPGYAPAHRPCPKLRHPAVRERPRDRLRLHRARGRAADRF